MSTKQKHSVGRIENSTHEIRLRPATTRLDRRTFMRGAAASIGSLTAGICSSILIPRPLVAQQGGGSGTITRNPLKIPPIVTYPNPYLLLAAPATADLGGGKLSAVLAYNGYFPGPTFRANRGGSAKITLQNHLSEETTVHWHGMVVPHAADGHPQDSIAPGASYTYQYTINQRACLNWYHPHPHMITGKQVCLGLAGAFIINDTEEAALGLPSGSNEVPLIIRDANLNHLGNLDYNPTSTGFDGKIPLVNGTRDPKLDVNPAWYRFRVLNGANARLFKLTLSNGRPFTLIGNDGGLLLAATRVAQIEFGPGERLDLLVDFRGLAGAKVMLRDLNAGWDLLEFNVKQQSNGADLNLPATLSTITTLLSPVATRTFTFDGMSKINGKVYDLNRIDFQVPFGKTELWRFSTGRNAPHPVHVHGASFQVKSRSGGRGVVFPWERGWKDTVLLQDGETVEVLIRFDAFRGLYLLHCHKLEHEDMGMMSNFEVI
jgi:blue copper oxidase